MYKIAKVAIPAILINIQKANFFTLAKETTQKSRYIKTGIRVDYPMPVFYFLTKFKVYAENFNIAK